MYQVVSIFILIKTDTKNGASRIPERSPLLTRWSIRRQLKHFFPDPQCVSYRKRIRIFFLVPLNFMVSSHRQDFDMLIGPKITANDFPPCLEPIFKCDRFILRVRPSTPVDIHDVASPEHDLGIL